MPALRASASDAPTPRTCWPRKNAGISKSGVGIEISRNLPCAPCVLLRRVQFLSIHVHSWLAVAYPAGRNAAATAEEEDEDDLTD